MSNSSSSPRGASRRGMKLALVLLLALAAWGVSSRVLTRSALARSADDAAVPAVQVVPVKRSADGQELVLPAELHAYQEAPIYARTSGYLKAWYTDIGSTVKRGQLMALLDTPEIDQQLAQAKADLASAQANYTLAQSTAERWQQLLAAQAVSQQDTDQKLGDAAARKALLASAPANLARLRDLESFKRVLAPFDGTVVARNTDVGALINAGQSAGAELFRVADTHALRIYVQVPQPYAALTVPGLKARLQFAEHPDRAFEATLVRSAGALDPATRSLQAELQVDNTQYKLLPGAYGEVHFALGEGVSSLRIPANTVLFRSEGLQVATVDAQQKVHLKHISQGRDFGPEIEVLSGLGENERVILNPSDSLRDGQAVRATAAPAPSSEGKHS